MAMNAFRPSELARRKLRRYHDDEDGSHTIEFVLWVPIFILILSLVVDVCFLFLAQSQMYNVASDTTRQMSKRIISTQTEAETYVSLNGQFRGITPDVTANCNNLQAYCEVTLEMNSADVAVTGILGLLTTERLSATVRQIQEGT